MASSSARCGLGQGQGAAHPRPGTLPLTGQPGCLLLPQVGSPGSATSHMHYDSPGHSVTPNTMSPPPSPPPQLSQAQAQAHALLQQHQAALQQQQQQQQQNQQNQQHQQQQNLGMYSYTQAGLQVQQQPALAGLTLAGLGLPNAQGVVHRLSLNGLAPAGSNLMQYGEARQLRSWP